MVRVRIAPSPTGAPHIGTAWLALFDFVFAKKNRGQFILRLEDTDRERYIPESVEQIYETLEWLGLVCDEGPKAGGPFGPYIQSERVDIYQKYADELLEKGTAYQEEGAVRFKTKQDGQTSWHDLVGNEHSSQGGKTISFPNKTQEDFVILKSDGYPTYNFANVIDDHLMEITHVIRGNEFISSTPKHLNLYDAFGWTPPQFAHLPVLVGTDRSKLSKRHGAKSALEFRDDGYLKEAVLNFLALLGWSHPEGKEIFDLEEMTKLFDFKDFNLASPIFDTGKLDFLNGHYIRSLPDERLEEKLDRFLVDHPAKGKIAPLVPLIRTRIKKLSDFIPLTYFFFTKPEYDRQIFNKLKIERLDETFTKTVETLQKMRQPFEATIFEETFKKLAQELGISNTQMFQLIRVSISGQLVTPPLFESIKVLGEDETINRVKEAFEFVKST